MKLLHEFEHEARTMRMYLASYATARPSAALVPAIQVTSLDPEMGYMEAPYGRLTVNLPNGPRLGAWGIHVKTWSENEELASIAMATGIFSELDMPANAAHTQAATWSIRPERIRLDALDFAIEELGLKPSRRQALTVLARESERVCAPGGICIGLGDKPGQTSFARLALDSHGQLHAVSAKHEHEHVAMAIDDSALDDGPLVCTVFDSPCRLTGDAIGDELVIKQMVSAAAVHLQRLRLQPGSSYDADDRYARPRG